jgi:hypothetical protein
LCTIHDTLQAKTTGRSPEADECSRWALTHRRSSRSASTLPTWHSGVMSLPGIRSSAGRSSQSPGMPNLRVPAFPQDSHAPWPRRGRARPTLVSVPPRRGRCLGGERSLLEVVPCGSRRYEKAFAAAAPRQGLPSRSRILSGRGPYPEKRRCASISLPRLSNRAPGREPPAPRSSQPLSITSCPPTSSPSPASPAECAITAWSFQVLCKATRLSAYSSPLCDAVHRFAELDSQTRCPAVSMRSSGLPVALAI